MQTQANRRAERGFTLVEVMVVIVILGMLATIVTTSVLGRSAKAEVESAKMQVGEFKKTLDMYVAQNRELPENWEKLYTPDSNGHKWLDMSEDPKDPWGMPYVLEPGERAKTYRILSFGPDKQEGTEDDITSDNFRDPNAGLTGAK
jgi:general secretion pathway protein G